MTIAELLLPEFDNEIAITRRVLERVPDDGTIGRWKPHEKSFPLAHLAQLVARLPGWVPMVTRQTELDIEPPGGRRVPAYTIETTRTLLSELDESAKIGRDAIAEATDDELRVPWHFKRAGTVMFTLPRYQALRGSVLNHLVHHRAQLGVYLRLLDRPVPSMYGPTADEQ